jgi:hypothetical protein
MLVFPTRALPLYQPPVTSPVEAVRAAIVAEQKAT